MTYLFSLFLHIVFSFHVYHFVLKCALAREDLSLRSKLVWLGN